jgi:prevent-host-death family protein
VKKIAASEFKARCLALLDQVHDTGQPITITKRGKVVAILQPAGDEDEKPWLKLRGTVKFYKDPFKPAVDPSEWDALK